VPLQACAFVCRDTVRFHTQRESHQVWVEMWTVEGEVLLIAPQDERTALQMICFQQIAPGLTPRGVSPSRFFKDRIFRPKVRETLTDVVML
jgi:hypothetical protein